MSSTYGTKVKISIFGESHGNGIGVVIDGLPSGEKLNMEQILFQMARRAPGNDKTATPRKESDTPTILSGLLNNVTTGAPMCAVIENTNTRSGDYSNLLTKPRPGHADYTGNLRYSGFNDLRGGGHFSGRLTAPLVFAGAVLRQILQSRGITATAHISSIGSITDTPFNPVSIPVDLIDALANSKFPLINPQKELEMRNYIEQARLNSDSVGGTIECAITGVNGGFGDPMFDGVESVIAKIIFGVPAVKGLEFGKGFELTKLKGSTANDPFAYDSNGSIVTTSNNNGGILGGITTGMPIVFKTAIKPTPSISQAQSTVDLQAKTNTTIEINGRHDPCIVLRAVPVIESAALIAIANIVL